MVKKLGISKNWYFYTYKTNYKLLEIENLIRNSFINFNIYISNIYIYEYRKLIVVKFNLWVYNSNHYNIIKIIIKYIKSILVLKFNKNIEFNIKFSRNIYSESVFISKLFKDNKDKTLSLLKLLKWK